MNINGLKEEYLKDLNTFLEYAESKRGIDNDKDYPFESMHLNFYFNHSKKDLEIFVKEYLKNNIVNNNYDFYYMLNCIIKYMSQVSDSHTEIRFLENNWFPIELKFIENSIYIDRCFEKKYLKKKICKINGIGINNIISEMEKRISYGTIGWLHSCIEYMLCNKNDLLSLPCIRDDTNNIIFEMEDGNTISFDITKNYSEYIIYPKKDVEQYKVVDDILIFKYPICKEKYAPDIKIIDNLIKQQGINRFILDLRGNTGGESKIIGNLIDYLNNSKLELFTLVNKDVFSSGRFAIIDMKRIGSKIVGEEIGTPINCFGYTSNKGILPNSNICFNFAKVYWYEDNNKMKGIYTKDELNKKDKNFFEPKYLSIDIPIEISTNEYINSNDDLFLKKCIYLIENERIIKK